MAPPTGNIVAFAPSPQGGTEASASAKSDCLPHSPWLVLVLAFQKKFETPEFDSGNNHGCSHEVGQQFFCQVNPWAFTRHELS